MNIENFVRSHVMSGSIDTFNIKECFSTANDMQQLTQMVVARQNGKDMVIVGETAPQVLALAVSILSTLIVLE